jgi:hypothetical protein
MGRGKEWSESDINYLDENWGKVTLAYLSTKLKRTKKAVVLKSKRLKLGASTRADEYMTARQVSVLLNIDCHTVLRWVEKHNLKAVRKVMLYKREFILIKYYHLLRWLKNNQNRFDSRRIDSSNFGYEPLWLQDKRKKDKELPKKRFRKWTPFEIQRIIELSKNMKYKDIAKTMNRSHNSIEKKFGRLKYQQA